MADNALSVHPALARLAEAARRDHAVELTGYVGPAPPDTVRIHPDFSMASYIEVTRHDILHAEPVPDPSDGRIRLWVAASATITHVCVRHTPARDYAPGARCPCTKPPDVTELPSIRYKRLICAILRQYNSHLNEVIASDRWQQLSEEDKRELCRQSQWVHDTAQTACPTGVVLRPPDPGRCLGGEPVTPGQ